VGGKENIGTTFKKYISMKKVKSILIVEDDPISAMIVTKLLEKNGIMTSNKTVLNGKLGIDHIKECLSKSLPLPELILLDINMPVMDGWEFLEIISHIDEAKCIPVVMLTSSIDLQDIQKSTQYDNIISYFSKPIDSERLIKLFNNLM
jgi:CheY-like chemotaxis protein